MPQKLKVQIRDLFIKTAISLDTNRRAWGQFLDDSRSNTQYGVYGTSAGIQALTLCDYSVDHALISGASRTLQEVFEIREGEIIFLKHDDIFILYKMAYLAEATQPGQSTLEKCKPLSEIISKVLPQTGWGDFYYSENERDEHPKVAATAVALLAISRYREFHIDRACEYSIRFLCTRLLENGSLGPHEYALAALALHEYKDTGARVSEYATSVQTCRDRMIEWARTRRAKDIGDSRVYYYSTCMEGHRENRYLFYFPDCLVALALLRHENPSQARRYVLRVVRHFALQTIDKYGYVAKATGKISSVDQLWIVRLMREFKLAQINFLLPPYFFLWRGANAPIRILLSGSFLFLGAFGLVLTLWGSSPSPSSRLIGGILAGVSFSLFGRTLWEFVFKREPS